MGGSLRRHRNNRQSKARVGRGVAKRSKTEKTRTPLEVTEARPQIDKRLNMGIEWEVEDTVRDNYAANKFLMDSNQGFGRNSKTGFTLKTAEERGAAGEEVFDDDDELRAGCNLARKTGVAPPPKLTSTQRSVVEKLIEAHGEDVQAMVLDTRLNKMQLSAGQLKKLIAGHRHWQAGSRHDFRAPRKAPKFFKL